MEKEKERKRRCESTPRYFILLTFLFFFHFRFFSVKKGYMWDIRLELAPVRLVGVNKKRKNEADLGFLGVLTFFWFSMRNNVWKRRERGTSCASALVFF